MESLEGWGGIQKRTSRATEGKLVPGRSLSLSKAAARQHPEREAAVPLLATPSPERLRQGLRCPSTSSPLTSPDLHSHDGLSGAPLRCPSLPHPGFSAFHTFSPVQPCLRKCTKAHA